MEAKIELKPQTLVDQKFEILARVAAGGMGTVYKARQVGLERIVALKLLNEQLDSDEEQTLRFEREALALSNLSHANIGAFFSYGLWERKVPYIAMEWLDGEPLSALIQQSGRLEWRRACAIILQICNAMSFAHTQGIVHRDLKPSNIILLNQPSPDFVKIVDFGLAKLTADPSAKKLTQTGLLIGTVEYMSPEQCAGRTADLRSDIYSLACVLYACLVSEPPFSSDSPVGTIYKHANELPLAPSKKLNESLCAGIDEILLKGLSKAPDDRYQSMDEFGQDLESLLKGELPVVASLASPQPRVRKTLTVATAVALSTFFAVVALFFLRPKPPDEIKVAPKLETLSDSQARVILDKATDFIDDDKPLEAEIICKEVLAKKLNSFCHIRALEHLATSYGMRKDFQKEAKTWDEVIRLTSADERKRRIGQPELEHDTVLANAIMTQSADFVALNKDAEALANFKRFEELGDRSQINESTRTQFMRTKGGYLEVKKGLNAAFDFYKSFAEKNANTFCGLEPIVRCLGILEKTKRSQTSEYKELSQKN